MNVTLNVTFDEAFNGTEKRITVRIPGKSESDTHTVKVPAGAVDGGRVRLKGQGDSWRKRWCGGRLAHHH